jgi:hypothetical protein
MIETYAQRALQAVHAAEFGRAQRILADFVFVTRQLERQGLVNRGAADQISAAGLQAALTKLHTAQEAFVEAAKALKLLIDMGGMDPGNVPKIGSQGITSKPGEPGATGLDLVPGAGTSTGRPGVQGKTGLVGRSRKRSVFDELGQPIGAPDQFVSRPGVEHVLSD